MAYHKVFWLPESEDAAAWTARGIMDSYKKPSGERVFNVGLMSDRQDMTGPKKERKKLGEWLNGYALEEMNRRINDEYVTPESDAIVIVEKDGFMLKATPNRSYGYMYIAAYSVEGSA